MELKRACVPNLDVGFFFLENIITEMEGEIMTERKMENQHGIVYFLLLTQKSRSP